MNEAALDRTGPLRHEHQLINHQLNQLIEQISNLPKGKATSVAEVRKSILTLGPMLKSHFDNEEKGLYESLEASLGKDSPTEGLVGEHRAIYREFKQLVDILAKYEDEPTFLRHLKTSVNLLQKMMNEHIEKEEKVVFWIAQVKL